MGLDIRYIECQTPLEEEEKEGLIPPINTRMELNELEQANIERAILWTRRISPSLDELLSQEFVERVHKEMFGDIWKWAGTPRKTNKNLGADKHEIPMALRSAFDDCRYWIEHRTFEPDETAVRFKHRIVCVHPFANGNGRHSRLIGDILMSKYFKRPVFSWGGADLVSEGESRREYLKAIREADGGSYRGLVLFARS